MTCSTYVTTVHSTQQKTYVYYRMYSKLTLYAANKLRIVGRTCTCMHSMYVFTVTRNIVTVYKK